MHPRERSQNQLSLGHTRCLQGGGPYLSRARGAQGAYLEPGARVGLGTGTWYLEPVPGTRPRYPVRGTGDWGQVPLLGTWNRCRECGTVPRYLVPRTWNQVPMPGTWNRCRETGTVPGTWYRVPGTGDGHRGGGPRGPGRVGLKGGRVGQNTANGRRGWLRLGSGRMAARVVGNGRLGGLGGRGFG